MSAVFICPSDKEVAARLAALRPRGDAWRNSDEDALAGSVMGGFFKALGEGFGPTERRICALVDEFFCSTAIETIDLWRLEYGVPDGCDPFADVCEKVNAVGDTTTAYAVAAAARRGWVIAITETFVTASEDACYGPRCYGAALYGATQGVLWAVSVNLSTSTAYQAVAGRPPLYGVHLYGDLLNCLPDIEPLRCLIRRIAPAHADLSFTTTT